MASNYKYAKTKKITRIPVLIIYTTLASVLLNTPILFKSLSKSNFYEKLLFIAKTNPLLNPENPLLRP